MTVVDQMEALARKYHEGQTRKDGKTPYIVHPEAVVARLRKWGVDEKNGADDVVSLAVGWGHDLLEDTEVPEGEILAVRDLGERILAGIKTLTFKPQGSALSDAEHDRQKAAYILNAARTAEPSILVVKLADRLCNTEDFLVARGRQKALEYLQKGAELLANSWRLRLRLSGPCRDDAGGLLRRLLGGVEDYPGLVGYLRSEGKTEEEVVAEVESRIKMLSSSSMFQGGMGRWDVHMAIELQRVEWLRSAIDAGADMNYRGYDRECIVHDIMSSAFECDGKAGNVNFARAALKMVVDVGLGNLLDHCDDDGYSPLYLSRRNPMAVALMAEFGVTRPGERLMPAPWKDEAYESFMRSQNTQNIEGSVTHE